MVRAEAPKHSLSVPKDSSHKAWKLIFPSLILQHFSLQLFIFNSQSLATEFIYFRRYQASVLHPVSPGTNLITGKFEGMTQTVDTEEHQMHQKAP